MNLVTSCPTCGTLFRVVPDQLRISDGWVRCGQCAKVFDAHLQMQAVATEPTLLAPPAEAVAAPPAVVEVPASASADLADAEAAAWDGAPAAPEPQPEPEPDENPAAEEAAPSELSDDSLWPDEAASTLPPAEEVPSAEAEAPAEPPAFVRAADRRAFWQGRPVRAALAALAGLLALLLGGQVLVHERDRIAAHAPATAPLLAALCAPLGCTLQPWRQIEAVVIDSSAFVKLEPQRYRLSLVLRNTAVVPLALPAIELSLTDSNDQAVMRRVVTPADWGAATPVLAAGGESAASVTLTLADGPASTAVTGYRVLAFYP